MRRAVAGFSLVELLLAIGILATAMLVMVGAFPTTARLVRDAQGIMIATNLAQQEMEYYLYADYSSLSTGTTTKSATYTMSSTREGFSPTNTTFYVDTTVTQPPTSIATAGYMLQISKHVYWQDTTTKSTNAYHNVYLETYVAKK